MTIGRLRSRRVAVVYHGVKQLHVISHRPEALVKELSIVVRERKTGDGRIRNVPSYHLRRTHIERRDVGRRLLRLADVRLVPLRFSPTFSGVLTQSGAADTFTSARDCEGMPSANEAISACFATLPIMSTCLSFACILPKAFRATLLRLREILRPPERLCPSRRRKPNRQEAS